jgi:ABC-type multidrug transport system fused ATPase/permease subunit
LRTLEVDDIWLVNPERSADVLGKKLDAAFKKRVASGDPKPLVKALYDTFKWEFIFGGFCQLMSSVLQSLAPFVLRYLINFSVEAYVAKQRDIPGPSIGKGIGLVIGITAMQLIQSMATNHFMYRGMIIGGQARAVLIAVIFDKAMRLSGRAKAGGKPLEAPEAPPPDVKPGSPEEKKWYKRMLKRKEKEAKAKPGDKGDKGVLGDGQGWGNGRIINLMSTDTYRVDQASGMFHMTWASPVAILLTLALLCINLTYSALAGFGLLMLTMPLLGMAVQSLFKRRVGINKMTDQRVSLTQEILQAVRFVKYFGWETSFLARVDEIRTKEIHAIQILLSIRNGILAVGMSMPVFASMLSFITYSLSNHVLNPAPIFSSLALFNSLRLPLNFLPVVIGQVTDAVGSLNRIQEFLMAEEAHDDAEWDYTNKDAIVIKHADFTWERTPTQDAEDDTSKRPQDQKKAKDAAKEAAKAKKTKMPQKEEIDVGDATDTSSTLTVEEPFKLRDIDLAIRRNELIAVIGTVGSGKSSLLGALAGDMRRTGGEVILGASRAFCPQYAWIQNTTVRENIVFGKEFDHRWYNEVIDACALRPDLEMLPAGDKTEIGERGITVSGGQKQRLNIARAIYFDADMVLMDDPLSAVDAHVGRHIMDYAICGLLKDKCRVLATHQLHVLNRCDRVVLLNEGRIEAVDTYDNLMANNESFIKLMKTTATEEQHKEEEEVNGDEIEEEKKIVKKRRNKKQAVALMQQEERAVKSVSWGVWLAYIRAAGGLWIAPYTLLLLIMSQGANITTSLWLSWWTSDKFGFTEGAYVSLLRSNDFQILIIADWCLRSSWIRSSIPHVRFLRRSLGLRH